MRRPHLQPLTAARSSAARSSPEEGPDPPHAITSCVRMFFVAPDGHVHELFGRARSRGSVTPLTKNSKSTSSGPAIAKLRCSAASTPTPRASRSIAPASAARWRQGSKCREVPAKLDRTQQAEGLRRRGNPTSLPARPARKSEVRECVRRRFAQRRGPGRSSSGGGVRTTPGQEARPAKAGAATSISRMAGRATRRAASRAPEQSSARIASASQWPTRPPIAVEFVLGQKPIKRRDHA